MNLMMIRLPAYPRVVVSLVCNDVCNGGACEGEVVRCDDGNVCTSDWCDPEAEACTAAPADGACDDGDPTTRGDVCGDGVCLGTPYTCPASACVASAVPNGTDCDVTYRDSSAACDDGDVATREDRCDGAGGCAGQPYVCTPGPCEQRSAPDGVGCVVVPSDAGTACDDGDPCVLDDRCDGAGRCVGTTPRCDVGEWCDAGVCTRLICQRCETDADCAGGTCTELDGASRCLLPCDSGNRLH
jgi:hypothetical protein